jgi:hypothetical protein
MESHLTDINPEPKFPDSSIRQAVGDVEAVIFERTKIQHTTNSGRSIRLKRSIISRFISSRNWYRRSSAPFVNEVEQLPRFPSSKWSEVSIGQSSPASKQKHHSCSIQFAFKPLSGPVTEQMPPIRQQPFHLERVPPFSYPKFRDGVVNEDVIPPWTQVLYMGIARISNSQVHIIIKRRRRKRNGGCRGLQLLPGCKIRFGSDA